MASRSPSAVDGGGVSGSASSIPDLISSLRSAFRPSDFSELETALVAKEEKLKRQIEEKAKENEALMVEREMERLDKIKAARELEESQVECSRLKSKVDFYRRKLEELVAQVSSLEKDIISLKKGEGIFSEEDVKGGEKARGAGVAVKSVIDFDENVGFSVGGSGRPPAEDIVTIDSDDESAPHEIVNDKVTATPQFSDGVHLGQTDGDEMHKRKRASSGIDKNKNGDSIGNDQDVDDNCPDKHKKMEFQELVRGPDNSPINHCSTTSVSYGTINIGNACTSSRQYPTVLRQCEDQRDAGHSFQYKLSEVVLDGSDSDSDESSTSSDSETDLDSILPFKFFLQKEQVKVDHKKWDSEADMVAAFKKDSKVCLEAVCALYRQQISLGETVNSSLSTTQRRGFNAVDATRGMTLAKFLIDGDPQGKLKRSVSDLIAHDPKGLYDCRRLSIEHSKIGPNDGSKCKHLRDLAILWIVTMQQHFRC